MAGAGVGRAKKKRGEARQEQQGRSAGFDSTIRPSCSPPASSSPEQPSLRSVRPS